MNAPSGVRIIVESKKLKNNGKILFIKNVVEIGWGGGGAFGHLCSVSSSTQCSDFLFRTSVLSVLNNNQSLDVVLPFFIFVFKFFYEIYKKFLIYFMLRLIWQ